MSESEDSETAEWEREQMARGTQSKSKSRQLNQSSTTKQEVIDTSALKNNVIEEIEKARTKIEFIKKSIGRNNVEIAKSDKRIAAIKDRIKKLETTNEEIKSNTPID